MSTTIRLVQQHEPAPELLIPPPGYPEGYRHRIARAGEQRFCTWQDGSWWDYTNCVHFRMSAYEMACAGWRLA